MNGIWHKTEDMYVSEAGLVPVIPDRVGGHALRVLAAVCGAARSLAAYLKARISSYTTGKGVVLFYTRGDGLNVHQAKLDHRRWRRGGCLPAAGGTGVGLDTVPRTGPKRHLQGNGFAS